MIKGGPNQQTSTRGVTKLNQEQMKSNQNKQWQDLQCEHKQKILGQNKE